MDKSENKTSGCEPTTTTQVCVSPRVLIHAADLHKSFGGHKVLDGVSLTLREGEIVLLRGDNGSGKTTLLNILTGCLEPEAGSIEYSANTHPEVFRFPRPWGEEVNPLDHFLPERVVKEGICRTWQEARLFPSQSLLGNVAIAHRGQPGENPVKAVFRCPTVRLEERKNQQSAEALLSSLGLDGVKLISGDRISSGYAKRVAIARSARTGARVLFLDEPLAGLDEIGVERVLHVLSQLAHDEGMTLVIVEHVLNIPIIMRTATTVWTLAYGRLTSQAANMAPKETSRGATLDELLKDIASEPWKILKSPLYGGGTLTKATLNHTSLGTPLLQVDDLVVFRGNRLVVGERTEGQVIRGLSFEIRTGELAVLQAPNGWGKTTLLETLAGLLLPKRGTIKLHGNRIDRLPPWERSRIGVSLIQSRDHFFSSLSVDESLRLGGCLDVPAHVASLQGRKMGSLSGGEKRRVTLEKAGMSSCPLHLLDEPFEGLDQSGYKRHMTLLRPGDGRGILTALPSASVSSTTPLSKEAVK